MAKEFTCETCDQTLVSDRESQLVEKVKTHAMEEHNTEMEESEIRAGIEDT